MRMAVLRFSYGTMGSGKSTLALQIHHNLSTRGLRGLLCTQLDRDGARVSSRLGVSAAAVEVGSELDLFEMASSAAASNGGLDYVVCDEAQFYTPDQVEQLARVVDELGADVHGRRRHTQAGRHPGAVPVEPGAQQPPQAPVGEVVVDLQGEGALARSHGPVGEAQHGHASQVTPLSFGVSGVSGSRRCRRPRWPG